MEAERLIRSIDNKIYCPVSKSKLIDLINNGKINNFDELAKRITTGFIYQKKMRLKNF